jgi:hypothetical protein
MDDLEQQVMLVLHDHPGSKRRHNTVVLSSASFLQGCLEI